MWVSKLIDPQLAVTPGLICGSSMRSRVIPLFSGQIVMIRRSLSRQSVTTLKASPIWRNLCADVELQPEIRDDSVTVYYRGGAFLRNLKAVDGRLFAEVHRKYVPFPVSCVVFQMAARLKNA